MSRRIIGSPEQPRWFRQTDMAWEPFQICEREFSNDNAKPTFGLANIQAHVPDIEANQARILEALRIFKEKRVNVAVFPEFCLSGYFWEDEKECWPYMEHAAFDRQSDWIENQVRPLLDDTLRGIILNGVRKGPGRKFLNSTIIISRKHDHWSLSAAYNKTFLPGIEKTYTESGRDDRLVVDTEVGRFGFTTCYDVLFSQLITEYAVVDEVDAIVQLASWRAMARRDYPGMNVKTDAYYGVLWDLTMAATAASHQIWVIACNAVGRHPISGARFWGGSGIWAPSGLCMVQASRIQEELLIVHNVDIRSHREFERDEFDYSVDFKEIYRKVEGQRTFTRVDI